MNTPIPYQVYRHFKGGLYLVLTIAMAESTLDPTVVYMSLNGDQKVWTRSLADFTSPVPEDKKNPTGQKNRFELVVEVTSILSQCTTENLIKELKSRPDSPFNDLDVDGFNNHVKLKDYVLGEIKDNGFGEHLHTNVSADTLEEIHKFMENHPMDRYSSRSKIYKRVIVELESFD